MPTFVSGNSGRIRYGANISVAGLKSWKMTKNVVIIPAPHFETTQDANSIPWPNNLAGLGSATVAMDGWIDILTPQDAIFPMGTLATADLILDRNTPFGFSNVSIRISQSEIGTAIDATTPATFTAQGTVNGDPTYLGVVT
jgi:hypothetical protein